MKREILFRGKRTDNKEWIYGSYNENHNGVLLYNKELDNVLDLGSRYIDKSTLGQYVGINDRHRFKIFEGDILKDTSSGTLFTVFFVGGGFVVESNPTHFGYGHQKGVNPTESLSNPQMRNCVEDNFEVIGNIYDNEDLLK